MTSRLVKKMQTKRNSNCKQNKKMFVYKQNFKYAINYRITTKILLKIQQKTINFSLLFYNSE